MNIDHEKLKSGLMYVDDALDDEPNTCREILRYWIDLLNERKIMTTKTSKSFLITSTLAYHDKFVVPAETMSEATAKAEKIVQDLNEKAKVTGVRESIDILDWIEDENTVPNHSS